MSPVDDYRDLLDAARHRAAEWLDQVPERPIPPAATVDEVKDALGRSLPESTQDPRGVLDRLADAVEPGLLASQSPRFYGWVIGGTYPVALAADWLTSAWDQNGGMRQSSPSLTAVEDLAGEWLLDVLGLPARSAVGFVTGATTANLVGLAAAREHVLRAVGWDVNRDGLAGAPAVRLVAGAERHGSVDLAARYLGLGAARLVPADDQGRIVVDALADALADGDGPAIVCLQAGNVHSGAFDDVGAAVAVAHEAGAWVHVDGAFGLWAAASPKLAHLTHGYETADSWATDAHKTLNVPYDSGVAIVADPVAARTALGIRASYLVAAETGDPHETVPEMSRRSRGVPVWATLAWLGRQGVADLVGHLADAAADLAEGLAGIEGVEVVNDVVYTQVCVALADDATTQAVAAAVRDEGVAYAYTSRWRDRDVIRFSVSNWATGPDDVAATVDAVRRAVSGATLGG
ncbi:pyridoxal phosphate-dependent decarboxylase family protein [Cellulomonas fimi]|uniref:Aminotransferase class V n=1 Tax=Cellulomonas fimi (strain ATCC 484 / DSM 20113 / JCM 1341 / CCUG 24087 / LMG 16345 / NBRC 15513 / NCIMB 8980 / NCTC 7547 / NRS-133) TaxID=590998 RepID=F4H6C7_CELFA|nr:aminotransferase class V-fold PLP-dependent enzyme [Cellulomonas fimi]AEE44439.1 aminotransferase class V [Cellulomonas fimi ATCC 484]NNH06661.1 aspartate aminotransferase family protein [Cellulomonas fimi]VEH26365.1 L-2,4-diaminobutyrate decarboxylase [Cellulomonas fimi]